MGDVPVAMAPVVVEEGRWRKKSLDGKEMENPEREQRGKVKRLLQAKKKKKLVMSKLTLQHEIHFFQFIALKILDN